MQVVATPPQVCLSSPPHVHRESNDMSSDVVDQSEIPRFICDGNSAAHLEEERYQNLVKAIGERDNDDFHRQINTKSSSLGLPDWIVEDSVHCGPTSSQRDSRTFESLFLDHHLPEFRRILSNVHDSEYFRDKIDRTNDKDLNASVDIDSRLDWSCKYLGSGSVFTGASPLTSYDGFRPRPRCASSAYQQDDDDDEMICATPEQPVLRSLKKGMEDVPFYLDYRSSLESFNSRESCEEERNWIKLLESVSTPESENALIGRRDEITLSCDVASLESINAINDSHVPSADCLESAANATTYFKDDTFNIDLFAAQTVVHRTPPLVVESKSHAESAKSVIKPKDRSYDTLLQDPTLIKRQRFVSFNDRELSDMWPATTDYTFKQTLPITEEDITESTDTCEPSIPKVSRCASVMSYSQQGSIQPDLVDTFTDNYHGANLSTNAHTIPKSSERYDSTIVTATNATENQGHNISYKFSSPGVTLKTPRSPVPVRYTKPTAVRLGMDIGSSSMSQNIHVQKYHEMLHSIHFHSVHNPPSLPLRRLFSDSNASENLGLALSDGTGPSLGIMENYLTK
jgi:hypothetical protein